MSIPQARQADAQFWPVAIVRAAPALVAAGVITFSSDHSARLGLVVFGAFAVVTGLLVGALAWRRMSRGTTRSLTLGQAVISLIAGVTALASLAAGIGVFLLLVSMWAALTGFLELYGGLRVRPRTQAARDWVVVGAFTAVLAVVMLVIEPDSVLAVGLFGAYAVIVGVYLVIAGLSLKWASTADEAAIGAESPTSRALHPAGATEEDTEIAP